jgi:ubiquinone/menaquinone biosynthesis C-methylase UbiE
VGLRSKRPEVSRLPFGRPRPHHTRIALERHQPLAAGDPVLDIGCGLGGPSRQIAAQYDCHVTGIDLAPDYVEAGNALCSWLHLGDRLSLQQGDALALPFADESFTAAYMLHVGMNIADKRALFAEVARVLRTAGRFARIVSPRARWELLRPLPLWERAARTRQQTRVGSCDRRKPLTHSSALQL